MLHLIHCILSCFDSLRIPMQGQGLVASNVFSKTVLNATGQATPTIYSYDHLVRYYIYFILYYFICPAHGQ